MSGVLEQKSLVDTNKVSFIWEIMNFPSLQVGTGEFVRSSIVKHSDSQWCLKLFPNGMNTPNQVEVCLENVGFTSFPSGIKYKIAIRNRFGENCYEISASPRLDSNKFQSSVGKSTSAKTLSTTVTTNASCSNRTPYETSINATTLNTQNCSSVSPANPAFEVNKTKSPFDFGFSFPGTTSAPSFLASDNCTPATTTAASATTLCSAVSSTSSLFSFSSNESLKSSNVESKKCSKPVGPKPEAATNSLWRTATSSDAFSKAKGIYQQILIPSSSSTKTSTLRFLKEEEKVFGFPEAAKTLSNFEEYQVMVLSRELLFEMREDLLPNDVLTVKCEMEIKAILTISESKLANEGDAVSNSGTKLLGKNLEHAFENPLFSDVTLKVADIEFPSHKVILANRSKVFYDMFHSGMKETEENIVNLVDMKPSTAKDMLRYIYTGDIQELSMDRATELYVVANRYGMPELKKWTKNFILRHISPDSACDVAVVADLHGDEDLAMASKRTMKKNLKLVLKSEKWLSLSKESPAQYFEMLQKTLLDDND